MEYWCEKTGKHMGRTSLCGKTEIEEHINLSSADLFKSTYYLTLTRIYLRQYLGYCSCMLGGSSKCMVVCEWLYCFPPLSQIIRREYLFWLESIFVCTFCQFLWIMKWAENVVAKCEIAHYEQFLRLPQLFKKTSAEDALICACRWERVKANRCSGQNA